METNELESLIERYYQAQTTPEEEQFLFLFFQQEKTPIHLQKDKEIFLRLHTLSYNDNIPIPSGLKEKISVQIDNISGGKPKAHKKHILLSWSMGIAASLLVICGVYTLTLTTPVQQNTIDNPQEAYIETQKALTLFASKIDKGVNALQKTEETQHTISKQLNQIKR